MKLLIILMFFFGILLIVQGIYEERFLKLKDNVKIQYRFVPRSYYDEQIFSNQFASKFSNIFDEDQDEWSANQRTFTPYNIDNDTHRKLTNIFGDEYSKRGLYNDNDLVRVLQNIKEMRMNDFREIYGSNADKKDFVNVYGTNAENIIKKYYDSDYAQRIQNSIQESNIVGGTGNDGIARTAGNAVTRITNTTNTAKTDDDDTDDDETDDDETDDEDNLNFDFDINADANFDVALNVK